MLLYTDNALYVGIESAANAEAQKTTSPGPGSIGVQIRPGGGAPCFHFTIGASEGVWEEPPQSRGGTGGWKGAFQKTPVGWSAELEIPFSRMGLKSPSDFVYWELSCLIEKAPTQGAAASIKADSQDRGASPQSLCIFAPKIRVEDAVRLIDAETGRVCWVSPLDLYTSLGPAAPPDHAYPNWALPVLDPSWEGGTPKVLKKGKGILERFDYMGWFAKASSLPNNCGFVDTGRIIMRGGAPSIIRDPMVMLKKLKKAGVRKMVILCENEQNVSVDEQIAQMREVGIEPVKVDWNVLAKEKRAGKEPTWERLKETILQGNIYIQCVWGADRTGAVVGRLRTDFYGWTPEEAYAENVCYGYGYVYRRNTFGGYNDWMMFYGYQPSQYEPQISVALPNPTAIGCLVESQPKMDGSLEDEIWKRAFRFSSFHTVIDTDDCTPWMDLPPKPKYPTSAALLYTNKALYVRVECDKEAAQGGAIAYQASDKGRDADYWEDDSVNLFVQPGSEQEKYYQFITNVDGNVYDGQGQDKVWNGEWKCATRKTARGWMAVFEIPFSTLGRGAPANGDSWGLGLARKEAAANEVIGWNNILGGMHRPERFGRCLFLQTPPHAFVVQATETEGGLLYCNAASDVAESVSLFQAPP